MRSKYWIRMTLGLFLFLLLTLLFPFVRFLLISSEVTATAKKKPLVIGHRGASGFAPENTLAGFRKALEYADIIELDVHLTRDDSVVVIHDKRVDRTTNGKGDIKDLSFAEVRLLDAGAWFADEYKGEQIPTLKEVLELVNGNRKLLIELKWPSEGIYPNLVKKTVEEIRRMGAEKWVVIQSFEPRYLEEVLSIAPEIYCHQLIFGFSRLPPFYFDRKFYFGRYKIIPGVKSVNVFYYYLSEKFMNEMKSKGINVSTFTVNDDDHWGRLINLGVTGIITDHPDKLRQRLNLLE